MKGWECPRCHSTYAPHVSTCPKCAGVPMPAPAPPPAPPPPTRPFPYPLPDPHRPYVGDFPPGPHWGDPIVPNIITCFGPEA